MLIIPAQLTREYIIRHPDIIFVHSKPHFPVVPCGPAAVCKGLSNCYGVPVRWRYCKSSGYFSDNFWLELKRFIDAAIAEIPRDGRPIVLFRKIGNGDSQMHRFAPKSWTYMMEQLNAIKSEVIYEYK